MSLSEEIVEYISKKGEASLPELYTNFPGHSPASIRGTVYKLLKKGTVVKTATGRYSVPGVKSEDSMSEDFSEDSQKAERFSKEVESPEGESCEESTAQCFYKSVCEEYGLRKVCEANNTVICE